MGLVPTHEQALVTRIRLLLALLMGGLVLSGVSAFPLAWEVSVIRELLATPVLGRVAPDWLVDWMQQVHEGLSVNQARYPFLAYGTDWLGFAHVIIAVAFLGPYRNPVQNAWVIDFGIIASALVVPFALLVGAVREVPLGWRIVDCLFGVAGLSVLLPVRGMATQLERLEAMHPTAPLVVSTQTGGR